MIERFFRPFLGGIFLEPELRTSSRMFRFVFRMFSTGDATLPAEGMEAIPRQLAAGLPADSVRLGARASRVEPAAVRLDSGEGLPARAVVVATELPAAMALLGEPPPAAVQSVTCVYFAADKAPVEEPTLVLNGEGVGPVNNLCVPSVVAPSYAPAGRHLVSATVLGLPARDDAGLLADVRGQLAGWFGAAVHGWQHLRTYRIPFALPRQAPPALAVPERPVRVRPGLYVCGDHRDTASIQGAMASGRRAAEAVLEDLA
jgi:phytoene dehydrogenase-like protein